MMPDRNRSRCFQTIALAAVLFGLHAHAEQADRTLPIEIRAQDVIIDQVSRTYELRGNATLSQGTMRIVAERMIVKENDRGNRSAQMFGVPGKQVSFRQKRDGQDFFMEGVADRAEFDDATDVLQLFSNARLKNGSDEMRGEYIYYNSATEVLRASAQAPGAKGGAGSAEQGVYFSLMPRSNASAAVKDPPRRDK